MTKSSPFASRGPTFYPASNWGAFYKQLFEDYHLLTMSYPGWTLSDIKALSVREREYWMSMSRYRDEYIAWQRQQRQNQTP